MNAQLQHVEMLLSEQKAVLMQHEKKHQKRVLQRKKVATWENSENAAMQLGKPLDFQRLIHPSISFERQLTDSTLKRLLEKVFDAADEDNTGKLRETMWH